MDGDGLDDLMVFEAGMVHLFLGSSLSGSGDFDVSAADYTFTGGAGDADLSGVMSSAGDVDGDGLSDLLIATGTFGSGQFYAGKVYLVLGSVLGVDADISLDDADLHIEGEQPQDYFGGSMSSAGDVDGDGLSDFLVGALGNDEGGLSAGKSYLFLGSSLTFGVSINAFDADYMFLGTQSHEQVGMGTAGEGDMDGDGLDDLYIGAGSKQSFTGGGYVVFSSSLGTDTVIPLSNADILINGEDQGNTFGSPASFISDWDGDGLSDLGIGALFYGANGERYGRVYVFLEFYRRYCDRCCNSRLHI